MGFRLNRTYVLHFEGAMAGAEIKLRSTNVATVMKLRESNDVAEIVGMLADHVVEWNLEDEKGEPLPFTADAILHELEESMVAAIVREWFKAAIGVTAPLDGPSTSGGPFPEASIPMETSSPNRPS
jgi:hypothetical protein